MKIKRYLDKDMRKVLRRVRQEQGPDAVILSNRRVSDGIEVVAAIDYDEALVRHALGATPDAPVVVERNEILNSDEEELNGTNKCPPREPRPQSPDIVDSRIESHPIDIDNDVLIPSCGAVSSNNQPLDQMRDELSSMRELLEMQLSRLVWKDTAKRFPMRAQVLRNLARLGVAPDIANIVVNRLSPLDELPNLWQSPLAELAKLIPVADDDLLQQRGAVALIGPTGVGKTTTIAKMAARYAIANGADEIALVCADAYRIGAKEHLMAFANIVGVKVHSASNSDELCRILDRLENKKLVLIDTEGRSQRDRLLASRLAAYSNNQDRIRFYLTLSAASQESGLDETVRQFNKVPLAGCILTKIDEAGQLGGAISTLIRHDLKAALYCNGQRVPDDLHYAQRKKLWLANQAVECMERSEPVIDENMIAASFSQVSMANA